MPRLNRAESRERTRTRIIEAATDLFLRDGFGATSLEQVAAEAGFTTGAVYSNFANKTQLGLSVVDAIYEREVARVSGEVEAALGDSSHGWLTALGNWGGSMFGDSRLLQLELEVNASSARDGTLRSSNAARYAWLRERATTLIASVEQRTGLTLPVDKELAAIAVVGMALGIGLQRAVDPAIDQGAFGQILTLLGSAASVPQPATARAGGTAATT